MNKFLENIKRDLEESSSEMIMFTTTRSDVEKLVKAYEQLKQKIDKQK